MQNKRILIGLPTYTYAADRHNLKVCKNMQMIAFIHTYIPKLFVYVTTMIRVPNDALPHNSCL